MNNEEKLFWVRQNIVPIDIEYIEDEHDEEKGFWPSFWYDNKRDYISNYTKVHNNPWKGTTTYDDYPEYIHAVQEDGSNESYINPIYIEVIDGEKVNVYKHTSPEKYENNAVWCVEWETESSYEERYILIPTMNDLCRFLDNQWGYKATITTEYGNRILLKEAMV